MSKLILPVEKEARAYNYNESGYPVSGKTIVGSSEWFSRWTYSDEL